VLVVLAALAAIVAGRLLRRLPPPPPAATAPAEPPAEALVSPRPPGRPGGQLVVALRAEPRTLNPLTAADNPSQTVIWRLMADLVHVDRRSQLPVPALARRVTTSDDGRRFRLELRRGVRFSDGHPLDAGDVVFSLRAYLDEEIAAPQRDLLIVGGRPPAVRRLDDYTVEVELAAPYAVGERLFDGFAVLPEHRLAAAYAEGRLASAWDLATAPEEVVGLGPFRLVRYLPGQRLELERNPHYWKVDAAGQRLPYLERLIFLFVPSEDAQVLRFQAGESQLIDGLSGANFAALEAGAAARGLRLLDLGPGLSYSFVVFNLNDVDPAALPAVARKQRWFRQLAFRRAVSLAIDRRALAEVVYHGRATPIATHVSPGNKLWHNAALKPPRRSLERARALLAEAGFAAGEDGRLRDAAGEPVAFSILTSAGNRERAQMAAMIQADLAPLGIAVRVVSLEFGTFLERLFDSFDYEAAILALGGGDVDPNSDVAVLSSSGAHHLWHLGQPAPATPWEAEIDRLMSAQMTARDPAVRRELYHRVQELVAENVPMIFLLSPNVLVGAHREVGNFAPAILHHPTLWNADELYRRAPAPAGGR